MDIIVNDDDLEWTYKDGTTRKADFDDLINVYERSLVATEKDTCLECEFYDEYLENLCIVGVCTISHRTTTDINGKFDDCPLISVEERERRVRNKAVDEFYKMIEEHMKIVDTAYLEDIREIAEQMKLEK